VALEELHADDNCLSIGDIHMVTVIEQPQRRAWKVREYCQELPFSKSQIHEFIATGVVESVKIGGSRLILTPPSELIERAKAKR